MPRSHKHSSGTIVLNEKVKIEVAEAPFTAFESIGQLDVARLNRAAKARFEVGYFETNCCRRVVHAVVQKGMVTKLEFEPCKETLRITPELKEVIEVAAKKFAAGRTGSASLPIPVSEFLMAPARFTIDVSGCISICCFGYCAWCCFNTRPSPWIRCELHKM